MKATNKTPQVNFHQLSAVTKNVNLTVLITLLILFFYGRSNAQVTVAGSTGADATYTTLKLAFDAINTNTNQSGNNIVITIAASTTETATASLTGQATNSWTTLKIYPTTSGLSITGNLAAPLIDLNGADNVTIDGRVNATGSTKDLIITNTSTSTTAGTSTIRFINDATLNTVKYCTIAGSTKSATGGVIFFSGTSGSIGNNSNLIDNNNITCPVTDPVTEDRPLSAVYSSGNTTYPNGSNTISNNSFYDFLNLAANSYGINVGAGSTAWTISGNSFYETSDWYRLTAAWTINIIYINNNVGNGFTVSGNWIGGSAAGCVGTWNKTTGNNPFTAIYINAGTTVASSVQGNTFKNISFINTCSSANAGIYGINVVAGDVNIGTETGNTIGSSSEIQAIGIQHNLNSSYNTSSFYGIYISSTGIIACQNNLISSVFLAAVPIVYSFNFYGIYKSSSIGTLNISGNTIGNSNIDYRIFCYSASSSYVQSMYGIYCAGTGTNIISGNTIANIFNATNSGNASLAGVVRGINVSAGTNTIQNNTIYDLSIGNSNTNSTTAVAVIGISQTSTTAAVQTISGNTIYNLSNSYDSFAGSIVGINYSGPTAASAVSQNFIYGLSVTGLNSITASLYGIKIAAGATTYSNNIITLDGYTTSTIYGIYETGALNNNNSLYFNTVYIGGGPTSGALNSYALYSLGSSNFRNFRNNIFNNVRSNDGATGKNFAVYLAYSVNTSLTIDYNDYIASGTGGMLGYHTSGTYSAANDISTLAAWQTATAQDVHSLNTDPLFANATAGTTASDFVPAASLTGVSGTDITTDYAGATRASTPTMGAYEAAIPAPTITSFSPATGSVGTLVTISGTNLSSPTAFTIGGLAAIVVSNDGTSLVGMVMPGATTGTVSVTTAGGTATGGSNFTVTATPYPGAQQGNKLVGTGNTGAAWQGVSVAVSADGNTAVVGGYADNSYLGAVWIYTRSGTTWTQQTKLVGTGASASTNIYQGYSVAISADGNTVISGGYGDNSQQGALWVFTRSGSTWSQQGNKLVGTGGSSWARQSGSVALSADGNTAIVGGNLDGANEGAAWVFTRSAGTWSQQGNKLVGTGAVNPAYQGNSVTLSADGNTAMVGGSSDNSSQGAVWVYTRSAGTWSQQGNKLVGTGVVGAARQGRSVALSADGNTAIVGGHKDDTNMGAVWVYTRSGSSWSQQGSKLVGTGITGASANQGQSVSISADGNTAIVGGNGDDTNQGAAWVYSRSGSTWSQHGSKLTGTGNTGAASQGQAVTLSADGTTAMVGGYNDNSNQGATWVFAIAQEASWTGTTSTAWSTAGNWSTSAVPTSSDNVTIPDVTNDPVVNQAPGTPAICNNLTIASGAVLTIAPGKALTVNGSLTNSAGTGGLIIQSNASGTGSLIHNSDAVDATIQRYISGSGTLTDMQYHFVSVPLVTATASTSNMFLNSYLFDYTQSSGAWNALGSATTNTLDETRGYMIYYPGTSNTYSFAGQLNNGAFTALTSYTSGQGYNLVPNPYPSAIDWDASSGWTKTNIAGTLYYWPAGAAAVSSNYVYWNGSAGVNSGTRYVPAGQAFFVQATGSSPVLTMTNATRVHNAQAFWKEGERIQNLLRIKAVSIHNQAFDELLIHFREGATANFDSDFDANKLQGGEDAPQISSVAMDNSKLSINSLPFSGSDVIVPLAFGLNAGTDVTLTASGMESFYESIPIYLEDLTTNTVTDLRVNPVYTFSHAAGDNENRFQLRFKGVTGTPEQPFTSPGNVFVSQGQLFVDVPSMQQLPASLAVYDALGRQFSSFKVILNGIMQYAAPSIPGVYVVRIIGGNKSFTGKVVVGE